MVHELTHHKIKQFNIGHYRVVGLFGKVILTAEYDFLNTFDRLRYATCSEVNFYYIELPCAFDDMKGLTITMLELFIREGNWERLKKLNSFQ